MSAKKATHPAQPLYLSLARLGLALLTAAAITTQFLSGAAKGYSAINFFSFFTIESNIFAVFILFISLLSRIRSKAWFGYMRGAMTLCIVTTGIVYATLLSGLEESLQTTIPWVNFTLHYLTPLLVFVWWAAFPPVRVPRFTRNLAWLLLPLIYVSYSLIRGTLVNWYPYPFLDPRNGGYGKVLTMSIALFGVLVLIVALLSWLSRIGKKYA